MSSRSATDGVDDISVQVVRMRQELRAVGRERDAFIVHINEIHERLASDRAKYPSAAVAPMLKLTLAEVVRERDRLCEHVHMLHQKLAEQAFEAAAAKVKSTRRRPSSQAMQRKLSQRDREEAQKRIRQSIEKTRKENVEKAMEEAKRKEMEAIVAGRKWARKLPGTTLDHRCATKL
eukprot:scaffold282477_cov36-Tisochrysis_lutea.AAC.2